MKQSARCHDNHLAKPGCKTLSDFRLNRLTVSIGGASGLAENRGDHIDASTNQTREVQTMPKTKAKPIALYVRVSTDKKRRKETDRIQTTKSQRHNIRSWITRNHINESATKWYEDKKSGKTYDRTAFNRMMKDIDNGKIDTVIINDWQRLGRNHVEGVQVLATLAAKVRVICVEANIDLRDDTGMLVAQIMLAVAEWRRKDTVRSIKEGIAARRAEGKPIGRPRNNQKLAEIKRLKDKGMGVSDIARKLKCSRANIYKALDRIAA